MSANARPLQPRRAAMGSACPLRRVRVRLLDGKEIEFMGYACQHAKARMKNVATHQRQGVFAMFLRAWRRW